MNFKYEEYCYSHRLSVDDQDITEDLKQIKIANRNMFKSLNTDENALNLFKELISFIGEYEPTSRCEQCGNYDTVINLTL